MTNLEDITLQKMLEKSGVKQKDIAKLLNIHESTVSLKLSGKREMSIEEAGLIADKLKTTSDQIRHALNFANRKVEEINKINCGNGEQTIRQAKGA